MEPEINVANIKEAVNQLYTNNHLPELRDTAQRWLTKTQRSDKAWQFAWELMKVDEDPKVQYYGASALLSRIKCGFPDEVPDQDIGVLRDHLLQLLLRFSADAKNKLVFTRICVAFSHFIFKSLLANIWQNPVPELIDMFKSSQGEYSSLLSDEQRCMALLNLLTILPEEHHTNKIDSCQRSTIMHILRNQFDHVHQFLLLINQQQGAQEIKVKMIECLRGWLAIGISIQDCHETLLSIASYMRETELFEVSVECLICAFSSPTAYSYPNTIKTFVPVVLGLRPMLNEAISNEEGETIHLLTRLVCSLAENQTKLVLSSLNDPQLGNGLIGMVMDCTKIPLQYPIQEYSSPITYTFWYALQDDMFTVPQEELAELQKVLYPIFFGLAHEILNKARYPPTNVYKGFSADEIEQFRIFRIDISDTLMYIFNFLGVELITYAFSRFSHAMSVREAQQDGCSTDKSWQEMEACLYGIHSLLETISEYTIDLPMLPAFANMLAKVKIDSDYLAETLLYTIGTMVEWLNIHTEQIKPLMAIVLPYLLHNELTLQCVLTLKRLTSECGCYMLEYADEIMAQLTVVLSRGMLRPIEEGSVMQCAGYILSEMGAEMCMKNLESLLTSKIDQLRRLAGETPSVPNKNAIVSILELLSNLFQTLHVREGHGDQPAVLILKQLSDVFKQLLNNWVSDPDVVKSLTCMYDRSIRNLLSKCQIILVDVCEMMSTVYEAQPHPTILDLAQRITTIFTGSDLMTVGRFTQRLIRATIQLFENSYFLENPDVAQYFFRFLSMVVRKEPVLLKFDCSDNEPHAPLAHVFHCALLTLNLLDSESVKASSLFFADFLHFCSQDAEAKEVVSVKGRSLLEASLRAVGGVGPRTCNQNFADILYSIAQCCSCDYARWMGELTAQPDIPCANIDPQSKKRFVHLLLTDLKHKRRFRDNVENLSLASRGILDTEYGRATSNATAD